MRSAKDLFLEERETQSYEEFMHYPPKAKEKQELSLNSWEEKYERFLQNENKLLEIQRENHYLEAEVKKELFSFGNIKDAYNNSVSLNMHSIRNMFDARSYRYYYLSYGPNSTNGIPSQKNKGKDWDGLRRINNPFYRDIKK